jgi:cytochrome c biogenesis protein CcmG, thiol:disulfide interchange protein DsbE
VTPTPARPAPVRTRWWLRLAVGLLIVAPGSPARAESSVPSLLKPLQLVGYPAPTAIPDFGGATIDARKISLTDLRGKVVLVNFWASWCLECRPELLALERLHRELARQGLAIVGVNVREKTDTVRRYARGSSLTFPLVLDPDGTINARYGVLGLPATFLVGRDGRAVAFAIGPREWGGAPARALFDALLAEAVPRPTAP